MSGVGYWERLFGNNAQVWRAICSSSCEGRTRTEQRDTGSLTGLFAEAFLAPSRLTPIQDKPRQTAARTFSSFSPMPPVKTTRVDSVKRSDHRGHLLTHGIAEHLNSESRVGV